MSSKTVYAVLEETAAQLGARPALHQPLPKKGQYHVYSWNDYRDVSREIAMGLRDLGITKGDIVAIHSETRAEFYLADVGVMTNGSISAALYTSYPMAEQAKNLHTIKPKAILAENEKALRGLQSVMGELPFETQWIILSGSDAGAMTLDQLRERGRRLMSQQPDVFSRVQAEYHAGDHAILYLTSGATGEPKMGLVTHSAIIANIEMGKQVLRLNSQDRAFAFLPSAHIAQRIVLQFLTMGMQAPVWFSEGLAKMPAEFKAVRPTFFLAPPRVWERIYSTVSTEVKKRSGFAQKLFYAAIGTGSEAARLKAAGKPVPPWINAATKVFDRLVYSKIRERLGGRITFAASGAAPLSRELAEFYAAIGMPLIEGYGLTEAGVACLNPIDRPKPGSIGKLLPGVEARLAEDGELLLKTPCMFSGYFQDAEATSAVLQDGWLYTGDIAEFDSEGYLYITGRKKEIIVASNGKKIYPAQIEGLFKSEPLISQMILVGDKLPYITALFTIHPAAAETLKGMEDFLGKPTAEMAAAPPVITAVEQAVSRVNKRLAAFEQIRKFRILEHEFSIESGELTPTMKVRRSRVMEIYRPIISELYMGKEID